MTVERLLTLAEFMELAKVGRSTVFLWMKTGKLRKGVHYVHLGEKALRFPYPQALEAFVAAAKREAAEEREAADARPVPQSRGGRKGCAVNLEYGK